MNPLHSLSMQNCQILMIIFPRKDKQKRTYILMKYNLQFEALFLFGIRAVRSIKKVNNIVHSNTSV